MLAPEDRVLLVLTNQTDVEEVERHLLRIGIENIAGFLRHGMRGWFEAGLPFERTTQMSVQELHKALASNKDGLQLLDVRSDDEWNEGFIPTAKHMFVPYIADHLDIVNKKQLVAVYCGSGYRASIAASVLQRQGFTRVSSIPSSMAAW